MHFAPELISEVIEKNDIVNIVSSSVSLVRTSGSNLMGLCPFHMEKTPSFSVSADKQLFYCFGCGVGGTVVDYIMLHENLDFIEAIKYLADMAGIALVDSKFTSPERMSEIEKTHNKKKRLYNLNSDAAGYFLNNLSSSCPRKVANYIHSRRISAMGIKKFGIGWADGGGLVNFLIDKGYSSQDMIDAGLAVVRGEKKVCEKFRNRIMFPIMNVRGQVVGFGGRVIDDSEPKYLNSPETVIFNKGENLFGLNLAKNVKNKWLITEGYMDVVQLNQNGIEGVVASLGTAFTLRHANLIKRYVSSVVLCYDSDQAGVKAVERALKLLNQVGISVRVLTFKNFKDPDEYVKVKGAEAFRVILDQAPGEIEYRINSLKEKYNLDDTVQKIDYIKKVAQILSEINSAIELETYINKFSQNMNISAESLVVEIKKLCYRGGVKQVKRAMKDEYKVYNKAQNVVGCTTRVERAEKLLLNLMLDSELFGIIVSNLDVDQFRCKFHRKMAKIIYELYKTRQILNIFDIMNRLDTREVAQAAEILHDDKNIENKTKAVYEAVKIIKDELIKEKLSSLSEDDEEDIVRLLEQRKEGGPQGV